MSVLPNQAEWPILTEARRNLTDGTYDLVFKGHFNAHDRITPDYRYGPEFYVKAVYPVDANTTECTCDIVSSDKITPELREEIEAWLKPETYFHPISICVGEYDPM